MSWTPADERWHREKMRLLDERKQHFESQARLWTGAMWLCWGFLGAVALVVLIAILANATAP